MNREVVLGIALLLWGCGSDPLTAGRQALERGDQREAVVTLRRAVAASPRDDVVELYAKALEEYRDDLRRPNATVEECDEALEELSAIEGFADGSREGEDDLLTQALLCAARHRARQKNSDAAAKVIVDGIKRFPGFEPGSPVLAKAVHETAIASARSGAVTETTALAQVIFSAGEHGFSLAVLNMLQASGARSEDIFPVLADRAARAKTSDAAAGLAAGFATWHGHAAEAARWYDEIEKRASKDNGTRAKELRRYAGLRKAEAARIVENKVGLCEVIERDVAVTSKVTTIVALAASPVEGGVLVAWIEGTKAPEQVLKLARVGADGAPGAPLVVSDRMPRNQTKAGDVMAAYAPKNREASLALIRCGGTTELAVRCAPECTWARATVNDDGTLASQIDAVPAIAEDVHLAQEDVWWNVGCSNDRLVHMWMADTQLMRVAWFANGVPSETVSNLRLPGFSPWFEATGKEEAATFIVWADILGEGMAQVLGITLSEDGEVPLVEDETVAAGEPMVEAVDGRVEHLRLTPAGDRLALTFYPQGGDITIRFIDSAGRPMGSAAAAVILREDARGVRFDADAAGGRLGIAWTEALTDDLAMLSFQSVGLDGLQPSTPQHLAGLVRPDLSPFVVGVGDAFAVVWVDRSQPQGESVRLSLLRCAGGG